ncbi:MAG: hypothetical protein ABIZ81_03125 [Opitutaceae bacterium]
MPFFASRILLLLLAPSILNASAVPSLIADEAVAAVMKLRSRPQYTWDISTIKPGDPSLPPQPLTMRGAMTSSGEMWIEQIWPDGLLLETVSRRDGTSVVRTPEGWFSKTELDQLSREPRRGQFKWLWLATEAFEPMTPEEQLTRMLNESTSWVRRSDIIDVTLSERGASYWLGSGRMVPNATGKVELRLSNGLIRECRLIVDGETLPSSAGAKSSSISFERVLTFDYSASAPVIAEEAKRKLDEAVRR